jgi:hypothetical protein
VERNSHHKSNSLYRVADEIELQPARARNAVEDPDDIARRKADSIAVLLRRQEFCDRLVDPTNNFEQNTLVEVMNAVLSSKWEQSKTC